MSSDEQPQQPARSSTLSLQEKGDAFVVGTKHRLKFKNDQTQIPPTPQT